MGSPTIETLSGGERESPPQRDFADAANAKPEIYERAFEELWDTESRERVKWFEPFTGLCVWNPPYAQ